LYKIELHAHTKEVSNCSIVLAKDLISLYKEAGYSALVTCDHMADYFFDGKKETNKQTADRYLKGYYNAFNEGLKCGIKVYMGMEIRFRNDSNDYLLYGIDYDFVVRSKDLVNSNLKEVYLYTRDKGICIFQAHPFRPNLYRANPDYLDGVEGINMHPTHNSKNHLALEFAKENNLPIISGSDCHEISHAARGGILTNKIPDNEKELAKLLISGDFKLIK
jgi:predicted metal-dependent phosphoesterase TrpH